VIPGDERVGQNGGEKGNDHRSQQEAHVCPHQRPVDRAVRRNVVWWFTQSTAIMRNDARKLTYAGQSLSTADPRSPGSLAGMVRFKTNRVNAMASTASLKN